MRRIRATYKRLPGITGSGTYWVMLLSLCGGGLVVTMDGTTHEVGAWDLVIAHPPCTYLSNAGAARLYKRFDGKSYVELERLNKGLDAKEFFLKFFNSNIKHIAIENPIPSGVYRLPKYTQVMHSG